MSPPRDPRPERETRGARQGQRRRDMAEAVMVAGSVRIEELAERFDVSLMTVHRDLDELESRGLLRKTRGQAAAISTSLSEASDTFRLQQQTEEKQALAHRALAEIEPNRSLFMDDSTTGLFLAPLLAERAPVTVLSNFLPLINALAGVRGVSLIALGGDFYAWCSAFMGRVAVESISKLRADAAIMSTSAITDDTCFHQNQETVLVKRAMLESAAQRILLVDHTKFERRALHALAPLTDFDLVVVDWRTPAEHVDRLRARGVRVEVAERG